MFHCISLGAMLNPNLGEGTTCNHEETCTEEMAPDVEQFNYFTQLTEAFVGFSRYQTDRHGL